ncbi:MAG: RDD family protein [Chitinophagaceae bacterium]
MDRYNTFLQRFVAGLIDGCIFIPISFLGSFFEGSDKFSVAVWSLIYLFAWSFYYIFLHGRDGQTLGKKVMSIKVYDVDEKSVIGYRRAFYRESVPIILELIYIVVIFIEPEYSEMIVLSILSGSATFIWFALELVSMFTNSKRRAVHDFMGESVVIDLKIQHQEALF